MIVALFVFGGVFSHVLLVLSLLHTAYFSGVLASGTSVASLFYCAYDLEFLFVFEASPRQKALRVCLVEHPFVALQSCQSQAMYVRFGAQFCLGGGGVQIEIDYSLVVVPVVSDAVSFGQLFVVVVSLSCVCSILFLGFLCILLSFCVCVLAVSLG